MFKIVNLLVLVMLISGTAVAEFQPWDTFPTIQQIVFSETRVGFVAAERVGYFDQESRRLVYMRDGGELLTVSPDEFDVLFDAEAFSVQSDHKILSHGMIAHEKLYTSNGTEYISHSAYCGEGERDHHRLFYREHEITTHVDSCHSIQAVEVFDDLLLLGTAFRGERGYLGPGEGVIVLSRETGEVVKRLDEAAGLPGNLVRVVRRDPFTQNIWVATHIGLALIRPDLTILMSGYFDENFDPNTYVPRIFLSDSFHIEPFAVLARELRVVEHRDYYLAVQEIPLEIRKKFNLYSVFMRPMRSFPQALEPLEPFLVHAVSTGSEQSAKTARGLLCGMENYRHTHPLCATQINGK